LALDQFGVAAGARFALDFGMEEIGIVDAAGRLGDEVDPAQVEPDDEPVSAATKITTADA
jgi:hypothetical protein